MNAPTHLTSLQKKFIIEHAHLHTVKSLHRHINNHLRTEFENVEYWAVYKFVKENNIQTARQVRQSLQPVKGKDDTKMFDVDKYRGVGLFVG